MKKSIKIFDIINIFILSLFGIICVFPFVYEILISFSSKVEYVYRIAETFHFRKL